jgi:hypothetical protein
VKPTPLKWYDEMKYLHFVRQNITKFSIIRETNNEVKLSNYCHAGAKRERNIAPTH